MALCNYIRTNNRYCKNYCLHGNDQCHVHDPDFYFRQRQHFMLWIFLSVLFGAISFFVIDSLSTTSLQHTPTNNIITSTVPQAEPDFLQNVTKVITFQLTEIINTLNSQFITLFNC